MIHVPTPTHSCADVCLSSFVQISIWWKRYLQRSSFAAPQDIKQRCMYLRVHMPIFFCSLFKDLPCVSVFCLHVYMCTNSRVPDVDRGQKKSDKSPGTALWVFMSCHMGAGNGTWVLHKNCKSSLLLSHISHTQTPIILTKWLILFSSSVFFLLS